MNDHLLVEALRGRDVGAPAAMYAAYADRLYAYCWFQLRERDAAQVALRDAFVVAEAHIGKLRDPDRFGPWLYAIARLGCGSIRPTCRSPATTRRTSISGSPPGRPWRHFGPFPGKSLSYGSGTRCPFRIWRPFSMSRARRPRRSWSARTPNSKRR
jgi:hypothetical protein